MSLSLPRRSPRRTSYTAPELYRRVFREARPYRVHLAAIFALSLLSTPLGLLAPVPLKIAVDSVIGDEPAPGALSALVPGVATSQETLLLLVCLSVVLIAFLTQLRGLANTTLRTWTGQRLVRDFRAKLFRHAQRISLGFHDTRGTTHSTYRIQYDAPAVQWIAIDGVIPFVSSIVKLTAMIVVTALIDLQLALVALTVAPILLIVTHVWSRRLRGGWKGAKRIDNSLMSLVQETLASLRVVKAFGQEERENERFSQRASEWVRTRTRLAALEGTFALVTGLVVAVGMAAVLYLGVSHVQSGRITLGTLLVVMAYLSQLYRPLEKMSEKVGHLQSSLVSAERALSILDESPDVEERPNARRIRRASGEITCERVSFSYGTDEPVLEDVSFAIAPGTRVGIAGTTGAGKTTLLGLMTRFFDPSRGRVLLDGVDLRDYRLADVRNQFAIVLQEPVLFSASIAENIGYARAGARQREIEAAARAAQVHDFVAALPEAYETLVGERGMRLSGGERQRVSLARAFLRDAPILILDEPTSSVDLETEAAILDTMEELVVGRTSFIVAHRLSTLARCDVRLRVGGGRVVTDVGPIERSEVA